MPRLTWCTTGPLAFLPLHAAGCYNEPGARIFDYVVSSYVPTLSTLLKPHYPPAKFQGILAVGQEATAGCVPLPGTVAELDSIEKQAGKVPFTRLEGGKATSAAVLAEMQEHDWVHLACHASQETSDPTTSAFHLHSSQLQLINIAHGS
jgi:CHAT domain-containing protein